tara:strand:- start:57 stop:374 length:318 start_codon:yes stop_codon:yes gene_type:complete
MHVVIASKQDTAHVDDNKKHEDPAPCAMDYAEGLIELAQVEMDEIGWRKRRVYISDTIHFRLRLKSWTTPLGQRTISLRVCRKREDGSYGMERLVYKRVNGKIIK